MGVLDWRAGQPAGPSDLRRRPDGDVQRHGECVPVTTQGGQVFPHGARGNNRRQRALVSRPPSLRVAQRLSVLPGRTRPRIGRRRDGALQNFGSTDRQGNPVPGPTRRKFRLALCFVGPCRRRPSDRGPGPAQTQTESCHAGTRRWHHLDDRAANESSGHPTERTARLGSDHLAPRRAVRIERE